MTAAVRPTPVTVLRWTARVASVLSIGTIALFVAAEPPWPWKLTWREAVGLLFFPFGVVAGMIWAWKRELSGALLGLGSLLCFYVLWGLFLTGRFPKGWAFAVFSSPLLLFLAAWRLARNR